MDSRGSLSSHTLSSSARSFRAAATLCALVLVAGLVGITPRPASAISPTVAMKLVRNIGPVGAISPTAVDGTLLFIGLVEVLPARGDCRLELWRSDGTNRGTTKITDISQAEDCSEFGNFPLTSLWDPISSDGFFAGDDGIHGWEPWRSDGAKSGTMMIKDINPGSESSFPQYFTHVGETLFLSANDGLHGRELWRSDGTDDGTMMVKDINPGPEGSTPRALTDVAGTLFFVVAVDGVFGRELWKSDGTEQGTVMVKDFDPGRFQFGSEALTEVGGTLFFVVDDGTHGFELWRSDGTEEGTVMVKDINPGSAGSIFLQDAWLTNVEGTLFFVANDGVNGFQLWKSDGTEGGTVMVKKIHPEGAFPGPQQLTDVGGTLFFSADDGVNDRELWRSDGTDEGTVMVKNIDPGGRRFSPGPTELTDVGGTLFFSADDRVHGRKLWRSDGTEEGTVMVKEFRHGPTPSPRLLTEMDGTLFFFASGTQGGELWKTVPSSGRVVGLGPRLLRRDGVAQGRVRLLEENRPRCVRRVPVRVQRRPLAGGAWRTIRNPRTNMRGAYRTANRILLPNGQPRPGRYRAIAPRFTFSAFDGAEITCPRAVSPVRRVPRR